MPICSEERKESLANHGSLIQHLTKVHSVSIEQCNLRFRKVEEFEAWSTQEYRELDYACSSNLDQSN
jgi:hypothetical protein